MATSLSAMPQLALLTVNFDSPTPHPKRRNRPFPPPIRFVLPALTFLEFKGVSEYLEVLTALIDAPILKNFLVTFFHQLIFDIPQIIRFFGHHDLFRQSTLTWQIDPARGAYISFSGPPMRYRTWNIRCERLDWQLFSIAQLCSQIPSLRSSVESLKIQITSTRRWHPSESPEGKIDPTVWLQLFRSFPSVQGLEISEPLIAAGLPSLTGQPTADVLPSLHTLSVLRDTYMPEESAQQREAIQSFIAARQQSDHPITVSRQRKYA